MRIYYHKSYKELSLISFKNSQFFETITLNFITNMSFARDLYIDKINNFILMLIDKLIKHAIYVAITKNLDVKNFANLM
jgi:hypothetical protein